MNETKHTPGPWEIRRTGHDAKDFSIFEEGIASSSGCIAKLPYRDGRERIVLANSRLIAAAPELLELLVEAANLIRNGFGPIHPDSSAGGFLVDADAAIAKATGSGS